MSVKCYSLIHLAVCSTCCRYVPFKWDAINVTYKGRICLCSRLAHLHLLLAEDYSESGSQGRWLPLHVLINTEVTAQRGHFLLLSL